ncbi:hypothetical protein GND98_005110 [Clostridium butyricum]|jgi:hypothetical protein|uniref:Uncharacterized protein n=1 Tax=Clostridium butyricum TaxID=1492 RepID=A0A6L9EKV2_CLOBU|nr:hypothetical protein [Clostridium butyricum]NAS17260.1 hypothetical protein [Clostridium butyricum]
MSILSIFTKKKKTNTNELVEYNDICFVEPMTNEKFLSILPNSNYDKTKLNKIGQATKLNMFLQQLPLVANIAQSKAMEGAYKIVLPEGTVGKLMKYKNGMMGTPFIGENGKVAGHAGLVPLDASKVLTPLMVFSAISAVSGQYFMARIDKSLSIISKDVKEIIELIYDEKESDMYSIYDYYEYIKDNMATIIENESLKISILSNIQLNNNKMNSNIKFYTKSIHRKINDLTTATDESIFTSKRLDRVQELNHEIEKLMNQQSLCYELFCVGKMLELKVAEIYNKEYQDNIIKDFEKLGKEIEVNIDKLMFGCKKVLTEIRDGAVLNESKVLDKMLESNEQYKERKETLNNNVSNLINNIKMFALESSKEKEFYVIENELYTTIGV